MNPRHGGSFKPNYNLTPGCDETLKNVVAYLIGDTVAIYGTKDGMDQAKASKIDGESIEGCPAILAHLSSFVFVTPWDTYNPQDHREKMEQPR